MLECRGLLVRRRNGTSATKRWQQDMPMALWQLNLVGGIYLVDRGECKAARSDDTTGNTATTLVADAHPLRGSQTTQPALMVI